MVGVDAAGADGDRQFEEESDWAERTHARPSLWTRVKRRGAKLDRGMDGVERPFLALLRAAALTLAALLITGSLALLLFGLGMQVQRPDSVEAQPVRVEPADLAPPAAPQQASEPSAAARQPRWVRALPPDFRAAYFQLYRSAFAPFYRANERPLEQSQFFQQLFSDNVLDQIESISDNRLQVAPAETPSQQAQMRPLLRELLATMEGTVRQSGVQRELQAYKSAQRVQVCRDVTRTRTRWVEQWDYSANHCPYWYEPPYGCMSRRQVSQPYQERVCSMQFPGEIANPAQVMNDLQARYFIALNDKVAASEREAALQRQQISERNAWGSDSVWKAALAFGAFLGVMFLYLLVALERHHRMLSRRLAPPPPVDAQL